MDMLGFFCIAYECFCVTTAKLSNGNRDHMAFIEKSLLTPDLQILELPLADVFHGLQIPNSNPHSSS